MSQFLNQPWLLNPHFKELYDIVSQLADGLNKYRTYLKQQNDSAKVSHSSLTPTRTISESIELVCVPVVDKCDSCYSVVVQISLEKYTMYSPMFLNEFAPDDQHQHKNWVAGLKLEFPAMLYRLCMAII